MHLHTKSSKFWVKLQCEYCFHRFCTLGKIKKAAKAPSKTSEARRAGRRNWCRESAAVSKEDRILNKRCLRQWRQSGMFRKAFLWKLFTVFLCDKGDSQVQRWSLSSDKLSIVNLTFHTQKKRAFSIYRYNRYNGNFRPPFSALSNWTRDISVDWVTHGI